MPSLGNIVTVAGQLLEKLGNAAPEILELRAKAHESEGEVDVAAYWRRVAKAIRHLLSLDPLYMSQGRGPRPILLPPAVYEQVFQSLPHASLLLQPNLVIVDVNRTFLELSRMDRLDMLGADLFALFPDNPADGGKAAKLSASLMRVLETGRPDHMGVFRYDIRNAEGRFDERWWDTTNVPVADDAGRINFILHQTREVTGTVQAGRDGTLL